jgi:uncharacterized protein YjbI with pentapeptide repeats
MHSKDPAKSDPDFQVEIERILAEAERTNISADFSDFVFPSANYGHRTFVPHCFFWGVVFNQNAAFRDVTFTEDVSFGSATFTQDAFFQNATFTKDAEFFDSTFMRNADFFDARFTQDVEFISATFIQYANFRSAKFIRNADFTGTTFTQAANFINGTFTETADFSKAEFELNADFRQRTFSGAVVFRETVFGHDPDDEPGLVFSAVKIDHPEKVEFYNTDLGQALFHNTDVSKFDFTLVKWRDRTRNRWLRHLDRPNWGARFCLFEENVDLKSAAALLPSWDGADERNYSLIAETYQQLKRNYDAKGDYWTAGHWHYGELEMKRLHSRWRWRPLRWLSHHFSLVALYKYASAYGESYLTPLAWLAIVITVFAILYPIAGLELSKDSGGGVLGYRNVTEFFRTHPAEHPSGWLGLILHGFMTSISVAGFQRELKYAPSYPWGRLLALFELLLTTTLGGLFALAIRRQFKR